MLGLLLVHLALNPNLWISHDPLLVVHGTLGGTPLPGHIVKLRKSIHVVQRGTLKLVMATGITHMTVLAKQLICSLNKRPNILPRKVRKTQICLYAGIRLLLSLVFENAEGTSKSCSDEILREKSFEGYLFCVSEDGSSADVGLIKRLHYKFQPRLQINKTLFSNTHI